MKSTFKTRDESLFKVYVRDTDGSERLGATVFATSIMQAKLKAAQQFTVPMLIIAVQRVETGEFAE